MRSSFGVLTVSIVTLAFCQNPLTTRRHKVNLTDSHPLFILLQHYVHINLDEYSLPFKETVQDPDRCIGALILSLNQNTPFGGGLAELSPQPAPDPRGPSPPPSDAPLP